MANKIFCTKCGQEITRGPGSDEDKGNFREVLVADENRLPKMAYKHIHCPGQPDRTEIKTTDIDWNAPLPEADPASWIVK